MPPLQYDEHGLGGPRTTGFWTERDRENRPGTARNGIWSMRVLGAPVSGREM